MDIGQFYDADERRRQSAEVELGTEWRDAQSVRYELNWIEDTGELYVMIEPAPPERDGPFGDIHVQTGERAPIDGMTVSVVAQVESHEKLEQVLDGWQMCIRDRGRVPNRDRGSARPGIGRPRLPGHRAGRATARLAVRGRGDAQAASGPSAGRRHHRLVREDLHEDCLLYTSRCV